jgi:hypothetical protein
VVGGAPEGDDVVGNRMDCGFGVGDGPDCGVLVVIVGMGIMITTVGLGV